MRDETIRTSYTYETLFFIILFKSTTRNIKIFLRLPINRESFWIIADSTGLPVRRKKPRHISNESLYIFMKHLIPLSRTRVMKINNMKMLKSIRTQYDFSPLYSKLINPDFVRTIREKTNFRHRSMFINMKFFRMVFE